MRVKGEIYTLSERGDCVRGGVEIGTECRQMKTTSLPKMQGKYIARVYLPSSFSSMLERPTRPTGSFSWDASLFLKAADQVGCAAFRSYTRIAVLLVPACPRMQVEVECCSPLQQRRLLRTRQRQCLRVKGDWIPRTELVSSVCFHGDRRDVKVQVKLTGESRHNVYLSVLATPSLLAGITPEMSVHVSYRTQQTTPSDDRICTENAASLTWDA